MDADSVRTREDLVAYLAELSDAVRAGGAETQSVSASDLLEAASAWVADMDGYFANRGEAAPDDPSWALIAAIFDASLIYE